MKYIIILSIVLTSCFTPRPASYQMRIVKITPKGESYRVTLKRGYKEFVVYASNVDTLFVGKVIEIQTMQRIK